MASDKKRMLELGGWLERYLNPDIKAKEYKALATEAIKFYGIDFKLSENDISLQVAKFIESQPEGEREKYIEATRSFSGTSFLVRKAIVNTCCVGEFICQEPGCDDYQAKDLDLIRFYLTGGSKEENALISIVDSSINMTYCLRKADDTTDGRKFISELLCGGDFYLWWLESASASLSSIYFSQESLVCFFRNKPDNEKYCNNPLTPMDCYNELTPFLSGSNADNFKIVQKFSSKYDYAYATDKHPSVFPWNVVTSKIGIDFLMLGGQEYFLFCKHCGRFTVAKRKGCKEYCSDVCRTAQGRKGKAI